MNRCLNDGALWQMYTDEGTAAQHLHVEHCAECTRRYSQLVEELQTIGQALAIPPLVEAHSSRWAAPWLSLTTVGAGVTALLLGVLLLRPAAPTPATARSANVATFAADLSTALFAPDSEAVSPTRSEALYVEAALDAGQPCGGERFLDGECDDQLSALVIEDE